MSIDGIMFIRLFEPLRELFTTEFLGLGFPIGAILVVFILYQLVLYVAPSIGEYLSEKNISSSVYFLVCFVVLIVFAFGW